jgi:hypothetical protein
MLGYFMLNDSLLAQAASVWCGCSRETVNKNKSDQTQNEKGNMSTQKAKFELFRRLQDLGFTYDEAAQLRRIEMTLHRWDEAGCGDGNDYASWSIERDEQTGKPFRCVYPHSGQNRRYPIADREAGALRRLDRIVNDRNERSVAPGSSNTALGYYHQSDCRGAALYILRPGDVPEGQDVDAYYSRGICVSA